MDKKTIAVIGATGLVGEKLTEILQDKLPECNVRLFGNKEAGKRVGFRNRRVEIEDCAKLTEADIDIAAFMATEDVAREFVPELVKRGTICVDNSSAYRLKKGVPLVIPSVNGAVIGDSKLIANPNCSTIQTAIVVNALKPLEPVKLTAATYQSTSGAGKLGISDLKEKNGYGKLKCFKHPIYDNIIPMIGSITPNGYTSEEMKMVKESRKILDMPRLKVNSFCARVPTSVGHGVFVNLLVRKKVNLEEVCHLLKNAENILLMDDAEQDVYPMPTVLRNTKYVGVGRIYKDGTANAINMFVVADNLLRGAAYNAYEIIERIVNG